MKPNISTWSKQMFACLALVALASPVWAATQTVTLSVPGMNCAACPITVKHALSKVDGVSRIAVNLDKREADLFAVPEIHPTHSAVAAQESEIRSWWKSQS